MLPSPKMFILISALVGVATALVSINEGPDGELNDNSPVYFPVLPEDFKDFGIKLGSGGAPPPIPPPRSSLPKKLDMPSTTSKPTTTTVRLPINEHGHLNHIASEAVTKPPGPSYLTDSYYYTEDHTSAPGTHDHSSAERTQTDRESEYRGPQALQRLAPLEPPSFGAKMPSALALDAQPPPPARPAPRHRPAPSTTPAPILTTTPEPVLSSPPSTRHKNMKLRPAYTPIPTPAPSYGRVPARVPARPLSRPHTTTPFTPVRGPARRPKFESARVSGKVRANRPSVTGRRPSSLASYRTPTPTTAPTTTTRRSYDSRVPSGSAPRRQYVRTHSAAGPDEAPVYRTSTKAYRAPSSLYHVRAPTTTVTAPAQPDFIQSDPNIYVPHEYDEEAIPGEAGVDFPNYDEVPDTSFTCNAQEHPGLYADTEAQCQTFHICQEDGRQDSFLCPNGTIFNQQYFVCDWWYNFSCDHAARFYSLNALIYELPVPEKYSRK
ncbi:pollen-specific leucine-rich repeat extensin-like protein 1 [Penaeus monodon]|uniref:pollen-specific leucine-rich repeat extensin-like protein 1 n=1 Tax=Penaeus monodon TaxID=6687 RepID=UPI0018A77399|nr:pollen-specific leucine-rich repeat extensin-like protein 1 [Penaeus monodon]